MKRPDRRHVQAALGEGDPRRPYTERGVFHIDHLVDEGWRPFDDNRLHAGAALQPHRLERAGPEPPFDLEDAIASDQPQNCLVCGTKAGMNLPNDTVRPMQWARD